VGNGVKMPKHTKQYKKFEKNNFRFQKKANFSPEQGQFNNYFRFQNKATGGKVL